MIRVGDLLPKGRNDVICNRVAVVVKVGEGYVIAIDLERSESVFVPFSLDKVFGFQPDDLIQWREDEDYFPKHGKSSFRASAARLAILEHVNGASSDLVAPESVQRFPVLGDVLERCLFKMPIRLVGQFEVIEGTAGDLSRAFTEVPVIEYDRGNIALFFLVISNPERDQVAVLGLDYDFWGVDDAGHRSKLRGESLSVREQVRGYRLFTLPRSHNRLLASIVKVYIGYKGNVPYCELCKMRGGTPNLADRDAQITVFNSFAH